MLVTQLIDEDRAVCCNGISSKKKVLEKLSELLAGGETGLTASEIFDHLISRERLGSTGFGKGAAIPHSRIHQLRAPVAAFVCLHDGIDFDSVDNQPVDMFFGLLVPEDSSEEHLVLLSQIAQMFNEPEFTSRLRAAASDHDLFELLSHWEPHRVPA